MRRSTWLGSLLLCALTACESSAPPSVDAFEAGATLAWLRSEGVPLSYTGPANYTGDLAAFGSMVGSARLIGLGEATHGSHEFFTTKDRLFRYLIETQGVTGFAIEASMPEAFAVDTYVRTGVGNPAVLLSHLYFWTWNTQEVADLIAGLRAWNVAHPAKQVGFYGFDMQYPGMAIDSVNNYIARVAPSLSAAITDDYACLSNYRNNTRGISSLNYASASSVWGTCQPKVLEAYTTLGTQKDALIAASSQREFELAQQMALVVIQWEQMKRTNSSSARDFAMAANVTWLLDREGPGGKLFLWAHNYHIMRTGASMGGALAAKYGEDYLPVGFAFGSGGLNAVEALSNTTFGPLKAFYVPAPIGTSFEALFQQVEAPNYYVDLRAAYGDARDYLDGPRFLRSVGSAYSPIQSQSYYAWASPTQMYDVLIFIRATTPSSLLPFQY